MPAPLQPITVLVPAGLARALAPIATQRNRPIDSDELATARELSDACRRAHEGTPARPGNQDGLLSRAIPIGTLIVRTPTIRARLMLTQMQAWEFPPTVISTEDRAEYLALLTAWILQRGRDSDDLELLTRETAPLIVADLRAQMDCTLRELQAAIGEVARDLYPAANPLDHWAAQADADPDQQSDPTDWAAILLTLATSAGEGIDAWLDAPEARAMHMLGALRRRRAAERQSIDDISTGPPDPESAKSRAARAWNAFEESLKRNRGAKPEAAPPAAKGDASPLETPSMVGDTCEAPVSPTVATGTPEPEEPHA